MHDIFSWWKDKNIVTRHSRHTQFKTFTISMSQLVNLCTVVTNFGTVVNIFSVRVCYIEIAVYRNKSFNHQLYL